MIENESRPVVVGQGPNRTAWEHGLLVARGFNREPPEHYAEDYCARVSVTGKVGERLALLAGVHRLEFYRRVDRRNLNARWNGKEGKGDKFDMVEGTITAAVLLTGPWLRFVLLGSKVSRAFGLDFQPLTVQTVDPHPERRFLIFPHPSSLNPWWNLEENRTQASRVLIDFLKIPNQ